MRMVAWVWGLLFVVMVSGSCSDTPVAPEADDQVGGFGLGLADVGPESEAKPATCLGATASIQGSGTINGTEGPDVIVGSKGPDEIFGLGGDDTICGLAGNDIIHGGTGNDVISGGEGNDRIEGN